MIDKLRHPSLFRELLGWQLLVMMAALTVTFAVGCWQTYTPVTGQIDREMSLQADAVARFAALNPTPAHAEAVARQVKQLNEGNTKLPIQDSDFGWQVWTASGQLLSSDGLAHSFAQVPPGSLTPHQRHDQGDWRLIAASSPDGQVWVVIGQTLRFYQQLDHAVIVQMVTIPLIYVSILMVALWLATWRGLVPLQQLGKRIAGRAAGSRVPMAQTGDPLELQPITAALDAFSQREADLRAAEKRFFADAAHELRTPLAVVGAQAHVLAQEPDPARHAALLQALQQGVQRAGDVLSKVLTLSRLDALDQGPAQATVTADLGELLRERVEAHALRAIDSRQDLGLSAGPAVRVTASPALLGSAIDNLIDNALRYCPPGSRIDVSWGQQDGQLWWAVEDDGPGIPPTERERVFERFERGQAAHDVAGSGLGLAIAREVAARHGGSLRLELPASGQGCRFVMALPLAA